MSKQIFRIALFLVIAGIIGYFGYLYYVKPQREFIKVSTQECINKAMVAINDEVVKNAPDNYLTRAVFVSKQKIQTTKLDNCIENYDTILYSSPERDLMRLNLNSLLDGQNNKIDEYISKVEKKKAASDAAAASRLVAQKQKQDQENACRSVKPERDKYQACLQEQFKKDNDYTKMSDFMMSPEKNQESNICLQKFNYLRFGADDFSCMMMGISTY